MTSHLQLRKIIRTVRSSPQRRAKWLELVRNVAKDVEAQLSSLLQDIENAAAVVKQCASLVDAAKKKQVELAKMLILDVKTRWSSTHQMFGEFLSSLYKFI